ncbi:MAG: alanine racemase [Gemmatimonadaceae bacterium]
MTLSLTAVDGTQIYPAPSRAWLDVDLAALRRNAGALARRAGVPLIPMVKADAYGVGAGGVLAALEATDPWGYGVATIAEGAALRGLGVGRPIVVFTPILISGHAAAHAADLTPSLCSAAAIREWGPSGRPYHLAIDTGMNRAGVSWRDISSVAEVVNEFPPAGAYTHFHSAQLDSGDTAVQDERFRAALRNLGTDIPFLHTANSAATARNGASGWDAVRPGVFLYGVGCGAGAGLEPEPVVHLKARVVDLRWVEAGDTVSYDATYAATSKERIATVAAGYGDGYPRALSNRGRALLNGVRIPVRGLVTMDMTMFDVTGVQCEIGDTVTLMGSGDGGLITVEDIAREAQMSPYEVLTGLAPRLDRRYHGASSAA